MDKLMSDFMDKLCAMPDVEAAHREAFRVIVLSMLALCEEPDALRHELSAAIYEYVSTT